MLVVHILSPHYTSVFIFLGNTFQGKDVYQTFKNIVTYQKEQVQIQFLIGLCLSDFITNTYYQQVSDCKIPVNRIQKTVL